MATEFVCTSISSLGDGQRGYQVFTLDAERWRTDIMKVDRVSDRTGRLERLTSFTVEAGSALASQG